MIPGAPAEGAPSPPGRRGLSSREVRALRAPKEPRDPWASPPTVIEVERLPGGAGTASALTVFLIGAECPFTCVFCDLWRHTLDGPTPPGALLAQLDAALAAHAGIDLAATVVKLYNASNFFDDRAVPPADRREIARRLGGARRVVVECHPRLVGPSCFDFARALAGRREGRARSCAGGAELEVALGLETVHPEAFGRLGKGMELADFGAAAERLLTGGIAVRAFVQVGLPFIPPEEAVDWAVASVAAALAAGAACVALIPTRGGNGALELLAERGDFVPPTLADLEQALERSLRLPGAGAGAQPGAVVTADLWDLQQIAGCRRCLPARRERLRRMNLTGEPAPTVSCPECAGNPGAEAGGVPAVACSPAAPYRHAPLGGWGEEGRGSGRGEGIRWTERFDVAIVGSGFAGSILARSLAGRGLRVALLERGRHPRFALGESSTPLAAIALERLAGRYGLADLRALAAYGRWLRELPALRRGLKRGFTFLEHRAGQRLGPPPDDPRLAAGRLLVAASPNDEVADSHWLRSDVDAHLLEQAIAEGVDYRDGVELRAAAEEPDGVRLSGLRNGRPLGLAAGFVVDASGPGRFLARHLPIPGAPGPARIESSLLYGHFEGLVPLAEAAPDLGPPGPYPDERAAVHHLLEEGWMYMLPFDDALVSAGIELPSRPPGWAAAPSGPEGGFREGAARDPEAVFHRIAARYPTLAAQLGRARAVEPVRFVPRLQYRLSAAAGRRWLLLPGSFAATGPLFSTGIAWSLVAVERAARLLEPGAPEPAGLERYGALLAQEADWIERLVAGALGLGRRFEHFAAWSLLYFAAASFAEACQRLIDRDGEGDEPWCWEPFLGAGDPLLREVLAEAERRTAGNDEGFERWLLGALAPRDLCGFDLPGRHGLHPVDLDVLVARAGRLGLDREAVRASLPRLRGALRP